MARDPFIDKFISVRKERNLTVQEAADAMGIRADTLEKYESGMVVPFVDFIVKAEKFMGALPDSSNLENIFTQGYFGTKIPLLTDYDLINDCDNHIIYYMELPQLEKYGQNNLFALRYTGNGIPEKGILPGSILVFVQCKKITRDGVYAVISRGALKFRQAEILETKEIRITPLDSKRCVPTWSKTASARGRLVCCINTYD